MPSLPGANSRNAPNSLMLTTFTGEHLALLEIGHDDLDQFFCLIHHRLVGTADRYCSVVVDIDLHAGLLDDGIDGLSSLAHHIADLLRIDRASG